MTPEDIITELSVRLRRQGISATRADLEAFAAYVRPAPTAEPDIDALARRFSGLQAAAAKPLWGKRVLAWAEGPCVAGVGAVLLEIGFGFWLAGFRDYPASAREEVLDFLALLVGTCILTAGGLLIAFALVRAANPLGRAGLVLTATGCLGCALVIAGPLGQPGSVTALVELLSLLVAGPLGLLATLLGLFCRPRGEAWLGAALGVVYVVLLLYVAYIAQGV